MTYKNHISYFLFTVERSCSLKCSLILPVSQYFSLTHTLAWKCSLDFVFVLLIYRNGQTQLVMFAALSLFSIISSNHFSLFSEVLLLAPDFCHVFHHPTVKQSELMQQPIERPILWQTLCCVTPGHLRFNDNQEVGLLMNTGIDIFCHSAWKLGKKKKIICVLIS